MVFSEKQRHFGADKRDLLPAQCQQCEYLNLCYGECPKNRIIKTDTGENGLNYLCEGYRSYFKHTKPYFEFMANTLRRSKEIGARNEE